jgi:hypothetical protein
MLLKIIALIAAVIPIYLLVRSFFSRRPTRVSEGLKEFKKQANLAVTIFLFLICVRCCLRRNQISFGVVVVALAVFRSRLPAYQRRGVACL